MCSETTFIYYLADGQKNIYVGKANNVMARFRRHLQESTRGGGGDKGTWVRGLLAQGTTPQVTVLAEVCRCKWPGAEKLFQNMFKLLGYNMVCYVPGDSRYQSRAVAGGKARAAQFDRAHQVRAARAANAKLTPEQIRARAVKGRAKLAELYGPAAFSAWGSKKKRKLPD